MSSTILPPSYADVVEAIQNNKGLAQIQAALDGLPSLTSHDETLPAYTKEQSVSVTQHIATVLASDDGQGVIKQNTAAATAAIKSTEDMFISVKSSLQQIDQKYTSPTAGAFAPRLQPIHDEWRGVVNKSKDLATSISVYIKTFADNYVPMVLSKDTDNDTKVKRLETYIAKADEFATKSGEISADFLLVQTHFATFKDSFSTWAKDKSDQLDKELKQAEQELRDLQDELAKKKQALIGTGIGAAATLPITGIAAICAGPFAPAVIIAGLFIGAALTAASVGLAVTISHLETDVSNKQKDIQNIKAQIKDIDDTRKNLVELGNKNFDLLKANISAVTSFWNFTKQDAIKVRDLLKTAKGDITEQNWIEAAGTDTASAVKIYQSMQLYLDAYARGISI